MKKYLLLLLLASVGVARTEVLHQTIAINAAPDLAQKVCPNPLWHGLKINWGGVVDERSTKEIIAQVFADPSLDKTVDRSLQKLLRTCGLEFTADKEKANYKLSATIQAFGIGTQKKFLTQKTESSAKLVIFIAGIQPTQTLFNIDFDYGIKRKGARTSKLKRIEQTANELLTGLLEQIPEKLKEHLR